MPYYPNNFDIYNLQETAAYGYLCNGQYLAPTGLHPSQQGRYQPFGTLDFSAPGGRYEPQQWGYSMANGGAMTLDYELPDESLRWGMAESNPHRSRMPQWGIGDGQGGQFGLMLDGGMHTNLDRDYFYSGNPGNSWYGMSEDYLNRFMPDG